MPRLRKRESAELIREDIGELSKSKGLGEDDIAKLTAFWRHQLSDEDGLGKRLAEAEIRPEPERLLRLVRQSLQMDGPHELGKKVQAGEVILSEGNELPAIKE